MALLQPRGQLGTQSQQQTQKRLYFSVVLKKNPQSKQTHLSCPSGASFPLGLISELLQEDSSRVGENRESWMFPWVP